MASSAAGTGRPTLTAPRRGSALAAALTGQPSQPPREIPTVVQHEGWLFKRGAGYSPTNKGSKREAGASSFAGAPVDADSDDDAPPTSTGAGPGAATASAGNSPPKSGNSSSGGILGRSGSILASMLQGSKERRRYFMLVTTSARNRTTKEGPTAPKAELRYYVKGRPENAATTKPKGVIVLTADMKVETHESQILLVTEERTFYLRPDVPQDQSNSAKARTTASQWVSAIKFALQGLRAWELAGAEGSAPHPMQDRRSVRIADLPLAAMQLPAPGTEASEHRNARRSFHGENPPPGTDSPFLDLWASFGIQGYNAAVAYFGPVQTDLVRFVGHFASRLNQVKAELAVFEKQSEQSLEVVVKEQNSVADAMRELLKSMNRQAIARKEFLKNLQKDVVDPLKFESGTLAAKLDAVVQEHQAAANYVEGARKVASEAEEKETYLQDLLAAVIKAKETGGPMPLVPASAPYAVGSGGDAPEPRSGRRRSDAAPPDPAKLEDDLNAARQARRDAAQVLMVMETKAAQSISQAMRSLEALEKNRIETMTRVARHAAQLEMELATTLLADAPTVDTVFEEVDASKDVRATFFKLKAAAEKARPHGRGRRHNSLISRNEFLKRESGGAPLAPSAAPLSS